MEKAQLARAPDGSQAAQVFIEIAAVVPGGARGRRQQADPLIIADSFDLRGRGLIVAAIMASLALQGAAVVILHAVAELRATGAAVMAIARPR
jgi:hypothetical protein